MWNSGDSPAKMAFIFQPPLPMSLNVPSLAWPQRAQDARLAETPIDSGEVVPSGALGPHVLLEGDNLDGLKWVLERSDLPRPRLVLIDPPYNTDKRFFYRDRQGAAARTKEERRASWLGFMLPRLVLAHRWMDDAGVLLVHIDEHEAHYLQVLLTEIFGADNDLGALAWDKRNPKGDAGGIAVQHETILAFAKNKERLKNDRSFSRPKPAAQAFLDKAAVLMKKVGRPFVPGDLKDVVAKYGLAVDLKAFQRPYGADDARAEFLAWSQAQDVPNGLKAYRSLDEQGKVYRSVSMAWPNKKEAPADYFLPLLHPRTGLPCPIPARGWRNPPATMARLLSQGLILFGEDERKQPERKYLLEENLEENWASVVYYGGSDDALLKALGVPFDTPKPVELTKQLIRTFLGAQGGLVVDFFAGSGTVGHAAMELAAGGFPVRSVCMQKPEALDSSPAQRLGFEYCQKNGLPANVFSLTLSRLNRVAEQTGQPLDVRRFSSAPSGG